MTEQLTAVKNLMRSGYTFAGLCRQLDVGPETLRYFIRKIWG